MTEIQWAAIYIGGHGVPLHRSERVDVLASNGEDLTLVRFNDGTETWVRNEDLRDVGTTFADVRQGDTIETINGGPARKWLEPRVAPYRREPINLTVVDVKHLSVDGVPLVSLHFADGRHLRGGYSDIPCTVAQPEQVADVTKVSVPVISLSAYYDTRTNAASGVSFRIQLSTLDRTHAESIAALFPKSAKLHVTTLSGLPGGMVSVVTSDAVLLANGVNGGANETGIKRYRTWLKSAEKAGIPVTWNAQARTVNGYRTREAFESAIA